MQDAAWTSLIERGYVHTHGLIASDLVDHARTVIRDDLRRNYDAAREDEYSGATYCPGILDAPAITELLRCSGARDLVDAALGVDALTVAPSQIAIRWAHNVDRELSPEPLLDGVLPD